MVADRAYTMADLKHLANDTVVLPTVRDHLKLRVKESDKSKLNAIFDQELYLCLCYHVNTNCCYIFIFFYHDVAEVTCAWLRRRLKLCYVFQHPLINLVTLH